MASAVGLTAFWLSLPFMLQDTLQDKWSPCHNICTVLMSIQSMLTDPNCSSPANPEAAQLYTKDRTAYNRCVCTHGLLHSLLCVILSCMGVITGQGGCACGVRGSVCNEGASACKVSPKESATEPRGCRLPPSRTSFEDLQMLCSIACQPCTRQSCVTAAMCAWKPNGTWALLQQLVITVSVCCAGGCAALLPRALRAANSLHRASAGPQQQQPAAADRLVSSK